MRMNIRNRIALASLMMAGLSPDILGLPAAERPQLLPPPRNPEPWLLVESPEQRKAREKRARKQAKRSGEQRREADHATQAGKESAVSAISPRGVLQCSGLVLMLWALMMFDCGPMEPAPVPVPVTTCQACDQSDVNACGGHPSRCAKTGDAFCCVVTH